MGRASNSLPLLLAFTLMAGSSPALTLRFEGNSAYPARRLVKAMSLGAKITEQDQDSLSEALTRLAGFYRRNGHIQARIEYYWINPGTDSVLARIVVDEGPRFMVRSVSFSGNDSVPSARLSRSIANRPGRPFNPDAQGQDEFNLLMAYADRGHVFAAIESSVELLHDNTAALSFTVSEGRRVRVGSIEVKGNSFAAEQSITRRLKITRGDFFSRRSLLAGEMALTYTGLFKEARVQPGAISDDSAAIDIEVTVAEKPRRRFEAGLGYGSGDAFRLLARWMNRNVGGWGERLEFTGLVSAQLWRDIRLVRGRAQCLYHEPWLFGRDLPGQASLYYDDYRPPYTDYRLQTVGLDFDVFQRLGRAFYVDWRASQQWLKLSPNWRDPLYPSDTLQYHGRRSVFSGWSLNRMDDPLTPKSGYSGQLDLEYTGGVFGGINTYQRVTATLLGYMSADRPRTTLAARFRGGIIGDWGKTHQTPYYEKFFIGGPTTLRGYSSGRAGKMMDNGSPQGGKKMAMANFELRPAIYKRWLASVFLDVGILSDSPVRKMSLSEAFTSPGFGLRYVLPLGTSRIDLTAPGTRMDHIKNWKVIVAWGEVF